MSTHDLTVRFLGVRGSIATLGVRAVGTGDPRILHTFVTPIDVLGRRVEIARGPNGATSFDVAMRALSCVESSARDAERAAVEGAAAA